MSKYKAFSSASQEFLSKDFPCSRHSNPLNVALTSEFSRASESALWSSQSEQPLQGFCLIFRAKKDCICVLVLIDR